MTVFAWAVLVVWYLQRFKDEGPPCAPPAPTVAASPDTLHHDQCRATYDQWWATNPATTPEVIQVAACDRYWTPGARLAPRQPGSKGGASPRGGRTACRPGRPSGAVMRGSSAAGAASASAQQVIKHTLPRPQEHQVLPTRSHGTAGRHWRGAPIAGRYWALSADHTRPTADHGCNMPQPAPSSAADDSGGSENGRVGDLSWTG